MILHSLLVAIGGFFGAMGRFAVSNWGNHSQRTSFPYGTLAVNLLGSFALGIIVDFDWPAFWQFLLGTGFMGAFTTFSTYNIELIQRYEQRDKQTAILYLITSYVAGIGLAWLGMSLPL